MGRHRDRKNRAKLLLVQFDHHLQLLNCLTLKVSQLRKQRTGFSIQGTRYIQTVRLDIHKRSILASNLHADVIFRQQQSGNLGQLAHVRAVRIRDDSPQIVQGIVQVVHAPSLSGVDIQSRSRSTCTSIRSFLCFAGILLKILSTFSSQLYQDRRSNSLPVVCLVP